MRLADDVKYAGFRLDRPRMGLSLLRQASAKIHSFRTLLGVVDFGAIDDLHKEKIGFVTLPVRKGVAAQKSGRWIGAAAAHVLRSQFQPKAGQWIARLPQEDFCQATGRPPTDKYEADGGPTSDRHYRLREIHPRHWHELALRIGIPAQFWLNLQSLYDLRTAERSAETKRAVREIEPLDHAEIA